MKPYKNTRLNDKKDLPDVDDMKTKALKTSLGGRDRGYIRNKKKKAEIRRTMKRSDKNAKNVRNELGGE